MAVYLHHQPMYCYRLFTLAAACAIWAAIPPPPAAAETGEAGAAPVTAKPLREVAIHRQIRAPATVVSLQDSELSAEITALIADIRVLPGDHVQTGDILLTLDCTDYSLALRRERARLKELQADLTLARQALERAKTLAGSRNVSEELLDQREAELARSDARVLLQKAATEEAVHQVDRCSLKAPFEGVITRRMASIGELAAPGMVLLHMHNPGRIEVSARVQAADIADLELAGGGRFLYLDDANQVRLRAIIAGIDPRSRTMEARLTASSTTLLPGMAGELAWQETGIRIPADLLVYRDGQAGVMIAEGGRARFRALPGAVPGRATPANLPGDTLILIDGRYSVEPGTAIRYDSP